jgi:quinol monooxygenase YgiN
MFTLVVKEDEVIEVMREAAAIVLENEEDTLEYQLLRDMKNPSEFYIFEQYTNRDAWDKVHRNKPYVKEAVEKLLTLIEGGLELSEHERVV